MAGLLNPSKKNTKTTTTKKSSSSTVNKNLTSSQASKISASGRATLASKGYNIEGYTQPKTTTPVTTPTKQAPVTTPKSTYVPPTSNTGQAVKSYFSGALGTSSLFKQAPKYEFDVLPGSKNTGVKAFEAPSTVSANSTMDAARTPQQQAKLASDVKAGQYGSFAADVISIPALAVAGGPIGPDDAANYARLTTKYGSKAEGLWKSVKNMGSKGKQYLDNLLSSKKDDLTANVLDSVDNLPTSLGGKSRSIVNTVTKQIASRPVVSTLGALVVGTAALSIGSSYTGSVRSATTPSTATSTPSTATGTTPTATKTSTPTAKPTTTDTKNLDVATQSSPYLPASEMSAMGASTSSGVTGGSTGGGVSGTGTGTARGGTGAGYGVGEPMTDNMTAAQMKAMELQRQQQQKDVGVTPIGDEVDIATMVAARDNARKMVEEFGPDAWSMPEMKKTVQTLLAGNLANLNKTQPYVPEPVVDTVEQASFLDQFEQDVREEYMGQMDAMRKQYGMTDLESRKADITKQLQAVSETYQLVIDDIKANPNLPKGLAARRLTEVFEDQKFAANTLLADLQQVEDQLEIGNKKIDNYFGVKGIEGMVQDQVEKEQSRRADQFGYMVDSGAVAALSDKEIRQWANATGIPESAIKQMKTTALKPDKSYDISYETNEVTGEKYAIYSDKNDPLAEPTVISLGNFGVKPEKGSSSTKETIYSTKTIPGAIRSEILSDLSNQQFLKDHPDRTSAVIALSNMYQEVDMDTLGEMYDQFAGQVEEESNTGGGILNWVKDTASKIASYW